MIIEDIKKARQNINNILNENPKVTRGDLIHIVKKIQKKGGKILNLTEIHPTPFYIFDQQELVDGMNAFVKAFKKYLPKFKPYYALKLNHHPFIIKEVLKKGFGLDVASGRELETALKNNCKDILFYSPGKKIGELELAVKNNKVTKVNIDSFRELEKLGYATKKYNKNICAGVRIYTKHHASWTKYGIPIKQLKKFWNEAQNYPLILLEGIHSHTSRNKDATRYVNIIKELGTYLKNEFTPNMLKSIKYIDFGGGFEHYRSEGYYPHKTPQGNIIQTANSYYGIETQFKDKYFILDSILIEDYAKKIGNAIKQYLTPLLNPSYYSEPGRYICNNTMHIALRIVDVKRTGCAIADGGVNMVGWQRFEHEYFPLINLTHPSLNEIVYKIYGHLCTTWDIWGFYCYAKTIKEGDIIIVPNQGALTYSLAQNWIYPIPKVYKLGTN